MLQPMRQMLTSLADVATHVKALVRDLWQPQDQNVRPKVRWFLIRLSFWFSVDADVASVVNGNPNEDNKLL